MPSGMTDAGPKARTGVVIEPGVQAATLPHNAASQRVLTNNGFALIGVAPRYLRIAGRWQDHLLFGMLHDDFHG